MAFPPLTVSGGGRYDDPRRRHSTLYAATERRTAFLETLDQFRLDLTALSRSHIGRRESDGPDIDVTEGVIPPTFLRRCIIQFSVGMGQRWLDVRSPETHVVLRQELASELQHLGIEKRFVLGDLLANSHHVTRIIAKWAIDQGFHGIVYGSCHDPSLTCWAIFDHAIIVPVEAPQAITTNDPDLIAVARLWNLRIPDPP